MSRAAAVPDRIAQRRIPPSTNTLNAQAKIDHGLVAQVCVRLVSKVKLKSRIFSSCKVGSCKFALKKMNTLFKAEKLFYF